MTHAKSSHDLTNSPVDPRKLYEFLKRLIDLTATSLAICLWAPALLLIGIAIKLESSGPIFYMQRRVGKNGKLFWFFKFRTMYLNPDSSKFQAVLEKGMNDFLNAGAAVPIVPHDVRFTKVGKFLRDTSLDELPQFFAVLRGDMSLVGPRPMLPYEFDAIRDEQRQRFSVLPGITGLWQISLSRNSGFNEMVQTDIEYIKKRSILLDMKIIVKTISGVIFGNATR